MVDTKVLETCEGGYYLFSTGIYKVDVYAEMNIVKGEFDPDPENKSECLGFVVTYNKYPLFRDESVDTCKIFLRKLMRWILKPGNANVSVKELMSNKYMEML